MPIIVWWIWGFVAYYSIGHGWWWTLPKHILTRPPQGIPRILRINISTKLAFYLLVHRAHKTASIMSTKNTLTKKGYTPIRIHYVRAAEITPFGMLGSLDQPKW